MTHLSHVQEAGPDELPACGNSTPRTSWDGMTVVISVGPSSQNK